MNGKESSKPLVVACIPVLNEERSICRVIVRTLKHVDRVIICDDGSMGLTGEIAENLGPPSSGTRGTLGMGLR